MITKNQSSLFIIVTVCSTSCSSSFRNIGTVTIITGTIYYLLVFQVSVSLFINKELITL